MYSPFPFKRYFAPCRVKNNYIMENEKMARIPGKSLFMVGGWFIFGLVCNVRRKELI